MEPTMGPANKGKTPTRGATWLGVGLKSGGQLLFGGVETEAGYFFNLDNNTAGHYYSMTSSRWGFGLGGGGGVSIICVFNSNEIWWLNGKEQSDWGVEVSLGGKWKDVIRATDKSILAILKFLAKNPAAFLQNLDKLRDFAHVVYNTFDVMNRKEEHPILCLDIPFLGEGLELSAFKKSGKIWIDPVYEQVFEKGVLRNLPGRR